MKIAQLTLTGYYNYGNMLQKFALHHTLKKFTDSTEVLCPTDSRFFPETGVKRYAQCVLNPEKKSRVHGRLLSARGSSTK